MKTSTVLSAIALALPAMAAPAASSPSPAVTPIATPQNDCQRNYNSCLAAGNAEVICSCEMTSCLGEDAARIADWCASKTSTLSRIPFATATSTSSSVPYATPTPFTAIASRNGTVIEDVEIHANGSALWLGKESAAYCPDIEGYTCNNTTATQFFIRGDRLNLYTDVPGGQQLYIAADGHVGYNTPHTGYIAEGSVATGFSIVDGINIRYNDSNFLACYDDNAFKIFAAAVKKEGAELCNAFEFSITNSTLPAAWAYS